MGCSVINVITSHSIYDVFLFRSEHGILSNWYPSGELMPFKGSVPFSYIKDHSKLPTITLREAAQTGRDKLKCTCKKGCKDKHCACRAAGFNCSSHCHPKSKSCANQMESDCEITGVVKVEKSTKIKASQNEAKGGRVLTKKATLSTTSAEKLDKAIKEGKWLGDIHINAALKMIKSQFPSLAGLYDCLLGQNLSYPVTNKAFIQILHVDGNHWIAVEHVSSDCVNIYDSVYSSVSTDTKIQIASLLHTGNHRITLKIHKVQIQDRASDCGVYSIAFATDLAYMYMATTQLVVSMNKQS